MKILSKLIFIVLIYKILNFSNVCGTEVFEKGEDVVYSQRQGSQFDPRLFKEYIQEKKKEARKQGLEEGSFEKAKTVALRMLSKGMQENIIAEMTDLSPQQIQDIKASLK